MDGTICYSNISKITIRNTLLTMINIFPNPVQDRLNITFTNNNANSYKLRILTDVGSEVNKTANVVVNNSRMTIFTNSLANGGYLL